MPLNDSVPSSAFDVLERNAQDTDKFVNGTAQFTNRTGKSIRPIPLVSDEIEADRVAADNAAQSVIDASDEALNVQIPEAINALGLHYPPITYQAGLTLDSYTKTYEQGGSIYLWGGTLGTTTSGSFDEGEWQPLQGDIQLRRDIAQIDSTALLINGSYPYYGTGKIVSTLGYTTSGDGGAAKWKATSTTGLTPSQSPADRGAAELVDGSGRLWEYSSDKPSTKHFGAKADGVTDDSGALSAACVYCNLNNLDLFWPTGIHETSGNIQEFTFVTHYGPGVIRNGSDVYRVTNGFSNVNTLYVGEAGDNNNDGLTPSNPIADVSRAFVFAGFNPLSGENGIFKIKVLAGNYTGPLFKASEAANVPSFTNPILVEGDYSGTYPNITHNTVFTGTGGRSQDFYETLNGQGSKIQIHGISISNYSRAHEHWEGGTTEMRYCSISDCDFAISCQGRVDVDFRYNVVSNVDRVGLLTYSSRVAVYYNTVTNCDDGFEVSRCTAAHVDFNDFDGVDRAIISTLNARIVAVSNKFRNTNIAHWSHSGGIVADDTPDYGVIGTDTLQTVVTNGMGQNLRYNSYDGGREHIQDVWAALESVTGGSSLLLTAPWNGAIDYIARAPAGVMGGRFTKLKAEVVGSATYSTALNSIEFDVLGSTYSIDLPSTSASSRAFKVEANFYSSDSGYADGYQRATPETGGTVQLIAMQDGEPVACTFALWSTPSTIRQSDVRLKVRLVSGGGAINTRRVIGTVC